MNQADPLAELRDIHLPDPIMWWPLAPGWWLLLLLGVAGLIIVSRILLKRYKNRSYRRQALAQLNQLASGEPQQRLIALFELLKQVAISAYPQHNFASLAPRDFVHFLQNSGKHSVFNELPDNWQAMLYAQQQPIEDQLIEQLIVSAKLWIKKHPRAELLEYKPIC